MGGGGGGTHLSWTESVNVGHGPVQRHRVAAGVPHDPLEDKVHVRYWASARFLVLGSPGSKRRSKTQALIPECFCLFVTFNLDLGRTVLPVKVKTCGRWFSLLMFRPADPAAPGP